MSQKMNLMWVGLLLVALVAGFSLGKVGNKYSPKPEKHEHKINEERLRNKEKNGENWAFINPLLDCADIDSISNETINEVKQNVISFIEKEKSNGIGDAAVYFRDLNNGPWFGINEKGEFLPASLLKVPLMMNVFKQAMMQPDFLSKQFVWTGGSNNKEYFKASDELEKDQAYTIGEAVAYMIRYSDNNSSQILSYALDTSTLLSSYSELGISPPDKFGYSISVRTYASFFRILYNSTFLSKEFSEKSLRLLSEVDFDKGLVAGVPPTIKVAHKFGERQLEGTSKQLHDCGIIYLPEKPYILCVMTRSSSSSFDSMAKFIAGVSKVVYEGVKE